MLQSYFLQFEQTPLTTIFTLSREKLLGRLIVGTGMSFKQNVWLQIAQRKWTCRSSGWHSQVSWHKAYFTELVPSSMLWMSLFSWNVFSVRYNVTLSAFSNFYSNSGRLIAVFVLSKFLKPIAAWRLVWCFWIWVCCQFLFPLCRFIS